jgi:hypothetical protein
VRAGSKKEAVFSTGEEEMFSGNYGATITDEFMQQMLKTTRQYCIMILKAGDSLPR